MNELIDQKLVAVSYKAPNYWIFKFSNNSELNIETLWRLIVENKIKLTSRDHMQKFGNEQSIDLEEEFKSTDLGLVSSVEVIKNTSDINIHFGEKFRLEIITDSSGYESWTYNGPNKLVIVGSAHEMTRFG